MKPAKVEKMPSKRTKYLIFIMPSIVEDFPLRQDSKRQRTIPVNNKAIPWAMSPNITPNKNGKVTQVK